MRLRYFYRIDQDGAPIPGTLEKKTQRPKTGRWGEITKADLERKPCCPSGAEDADIEITGPTGLIVTGSEEYLYSITANVEGIDPSKVSQISIVINDVPFDTELDSTITIDTSAFAEDPAVPIVYYAVAVLTTGETILSPIMQFTLTDTAPEWSTIFQNNVAGLDQPRHIIDYVTDINSDSLTITAPSMPAFCTMSITPIPDIKGGGSFYLVDITVAPTTGDSGTYNFDLIASDGVKSVNKNISLLVDGNTHFRFTTRNTINFSLDDTGGSQSIGSVVTNTIINQLQANGWPSGNGITLAFPNGPGTINVSVTPTAVTSIGKTVWTRTVYNNTSGAGRYEDAVYWILDVA